MLKYLAIYCCSTAAISLLRDLYIMSLGGNVKVSIEFNDHKFSTSNKLAVVGINAVVAPIMEPLCMNAKFKCKDDNK